MARPKTRKDASSAVLALWKEIREGEPRPVYMLYGSREERDRPHVQYVFDRTVALIRRRFLEDPAARFNLDHFQGAQVDVEQALASARTVPMFGDRRLTLILDIPSPDGAALERLLDYVADPVPQTTLVVVFAPGQISRKLHNACRPSGCLYKAEKLRERDLSRWIRAYMDEQGLEAASGVEQAIGEYTGVHLRAVEDTVEKLALYTAGERRVEVEDVEQCVLAVREAVVFDLLDAIGERQAGKALGILESLSSQRSESLRLNAMLANQLRRLVRIRSHGRRLPSRDTVVSELGIHPFQAGKLLSQVRNFTMADLERALAASAEFNVQTKRTRVAPERLMEAMVLGIILGP